MATTKTARPIHIQVSTVGRRIRASLENYSAAGVNDPVGGKPAFARPGSL